MVELLMTQSGLSLALSHIFLADPPAEIEQLTLSLHSLGAELQGEGYERQVVTFEQTDDHWVSADAVTFGPAPQGADPTEPANSVRLWAEVNGETILVAMGDLSESVPVTDQAPVIFAAGEFAVTQSVSFARRAG